MRKYYSFFKIRFFTGLQYRAAAWGGIATQFAWGIMTLLMFWAFYQSGANAFPMEFSQLASYIWLQQAMLAMYMTWYFDNDIFESIIDGNVSYELCRPLDIYSMWFTKNVATRLSRVLLRFLPIVIFSAFLPHPFNLSAPIDIVTAVIFIFSAVVGMLVLVAFTMLIYLAAFFTISARGMRLLIVAMLEFFTGALVPIPFFPEELQMVLNILPFASVQSTPFLIYVGEIASSEVVTPLVLQLSWLIALVLIGKLVSANALKKVVVQGG